MNHLNLIAENRRLTRELEQVKAEGQSGCEYCDADGFCPPRAKSVSMGCSWSQGFTPVYGWTAVPTKITCADHKADSYRVIDCPEFERG